MLPLNRQARRLPGLLLALTLILCLAIPPPRLSGAEISRRTFALTTADAEVTLEMFSDQAGAQVVYLIEDVRGVTTNPVQGVLAILDALERLVAGTALRVEQDGKTGAFVIKREQQTRRSAEASNTTLPPTMKKSSRSLLAAVAGLLALGSTADAQTAALPKGEEPLVLSPFTVDTVRDTGYAASSTLSGTRFNTALRDVSAPVSILTPEFLSDIGAHTMIEAASFAVSAEREPNAFDSSSNAPSSVRIRGLFVRSNSQDFFNTNFPLDDYNLEQISINRGPNSLLFGVGSPGGLVTGVTKRASFTDRGSASLEVGSYARVRGMFDLNRVLVPDRVALRLSVLHRDTDTFREATEWKDRRVFAALTWKVNRQPNFQTTLRANYENGGAARVSGTLATPTDQISSWIAAGRPLVNGVRPAAAGGLPNGVVSAAGQANIVVVDGSPQAVPILNWISTVRGSNPVPAGSGLGPTSPVGLNYNFNGPMRSVDYFGNSHSVFIEQQLGANLFVELAGFHNALDNTWVRDGGGGGALNVDANRLLPNGASNPNAGQIYTEGTIRPQAQERLAEEVRLSVSYRLDLTGRSRWLGEHRLGLLLSERRDEFAFDDMQEVNTTPLPGYNARLDNAQNLIVRRSYLFQGQGNVWLSANRYPDVPLINEGGIRSALLPVQRIQRTKTLVDSKVFGTQSYLLDRRLVLTGGVRRDWNRGYTLDPVFAVRDARGVFPTWRTVPFTAKPTSDHKGNTYTFGAVAHVYKGVSLFYSRSESQDVADPREDWFGKALEVPTGFGRDLGLRFEGWGGRLTASLARFESGQNYQQINKLPGWIARINDMATILGRPELNIPVNGSDTQNLVNRGWEFETVFNPVKQWRIAFNASRNESITSNAIPATARFIEERIFPLEAAFGRTVFTNGRTLSQEIVELKNQILNNRDAAEGTPTSELREWTANLVTNYRFSEGVAKGFSVGGYAQYRGPSALGATINPATGVLDTARIIAGNDIWLLGLNLGYERRLAKGRSWSLRLSVANLLDNTELIEKNADAATGRIVQWGMQAPRSWVLRSTTTF
jgi:iron complex outermembrane recepter protein